MSTPAPDPLDLVLERTVDIPAQSIWDAWTQPEQLVQWFTPAPWQTVHCEIDLRPGGRFHTVMRGPQGEQFDNHGCYLEIVPGRRLVWTGALGADFRPQSKVTLATAPFLMTAVIALEALGPQQTRYTATVMHGDVQARQAHELMGFHTGWGKALDQLVEMVRGAK